MDVIERIRSLMLARGWTEYQLIKRADVGQSTVNNIFSRGTVPTVATLESIVKAFDMTLPQFFADGKEAYPLTEEQLLLLERWAVLNPDQRRAVLALLETMRP